MIGMRSNTVRWFPDCYLRCGFLRLHTQTDYMRWLRLAPDRAPTLSRVPRVFDRLSKLIRWRYSYYSGLQFGPPSKARRCRAYLLVPLYCHRSFPCAIFPVGRGGLGQIALRKSGSTALVMGGLGLTKLRDWNSEVGGGGGYSSSARS